MLIHNYLARLQILLDGNEDATWAHLTDILEKTDEGTIRGLLNCGPRFHEVCKYSLRIVRVHSRSGHTTFQLLPIFHVEKPLPYLRVLKASIMSRKYVDAYHRHQEYAELHNRLSNSCVCKEGLLASVAVQLIILRHRKISSNEYVSAPCESAPTCV